MQIYKELEQGRTTLPAICLVLLLVALAFGVIQISQIDWGLTLLAPPSHAASAHVGPPPGKSDSSTPRAARLRNFSEQFVNQAKEIEPQPPTF